MSQPIPADVQAAWDSGNRVEAIKLLRESTGLGLAEAKALLESAAPAAVASAGRAAAIGPLPANVRAALDDGDEIEAIKLLREVTGVGLKEAKDRVEADMSSRRGRPGAPHTDSAGRVLGGSRRLVLALAVICAAAAALWLFLGGRSVG
jgi:ribosomal protein L7/L12